MRKSNLGNYIKIVEACHTAGGVDEFLQKYRKMIIVEERSKYILGGFLSGMALYFFLKFVSSRINLFDEDDELYLGDWYNEPDDDE